MSNVSVDIEANSLNIEIVQLSSQVDVFPSSVQLVLVQPTEQSAFNLASPTTFIELGDDTPSSSQLNRQILLISTNGQTLFTLPHSPALPELSELYLNGVKTRFGIDFLIDNNTLQWLNSQLELEENDRFEFLYYV